MSAIMLPLHVDSTMLAAFRACPTKLRWEFVEHLGPVRPSVDLHAGASFAKGIEETYRSHFERSLSPAAALAYGEAALSGACVQHNLVLDVKQGAHNLSLFDIEILEKTRFLLGVPPF